MKYVSISDARKRFASMVDQAERTIVLRNNEPVAAIVGFEDFQALVASQIRERDPDRLARLVQTHRRIQAGDRRGLVEFSEGGVEDLLALAESMAEADASGDGEKAPRPTSTAKSRSETAD